MWPKTCRCGCKWWPGEWVSLPFVGFMDDGKGGRREMRNCTCQSSLTIQVTPAGLTDALRYEIADVCRNDARDLEGLLQPHEWPPRPRREPTAAEKAEADRLHDIADELCGVDTRAKGVAA